MAIDKITTASITDANITTAKIASGVLPTNTPSFFAYLNRDQGSVADNTITKVNIDTEVYDTNNAFASNKFTPGVAGKYYIFGQVNIDSTNTNSKYDVSNYRFTPTVAGTYWVWGKFRFDETNDIPSSIIAFYKNGSIISKSVAFQTNVTTKTLGITVTLDDNDYLEIFAYQNSGTTAPINGGSYPDQDTGTWGAYKIIL